MELWGKKSKAGKRDRVGWGGVGQVRGLNGVVRIALAEQVRFRQRCEGDEGELAK